jgi:hypothetical protein
VDGVKYEVNAESSDTIHNLKSKLSPMANLTVEEISLVYAGKRLGDGSCLSDYNIGSLAEIQLVPQPRYGEFRGSTVPVESIIPDRPAAEANIQAWKAMATQGNFDEDVCIVDPQAYYSKLSCLETDVIEASEFFNSADVYGNAFESSYHRFLARHSTLQIVPTWMWEFLNVPTTQDYAPLVFSEEQPLGSLWGSYLILCRVLASFDLLSQNGFSTSYYSILLEQPDKAIAEIVKISRETLEKIKTGIEIATVQICDGETQPEDIYAHLCDCVEETCAQLLDLLHLPRLRSRGSSAAILVVLRTISLVADLGLVSYVGSHATRFDVDVLHREVTEITIHNGGSEELYFDFRFRKLACLSGFLAEEKVWVFQCRSTGPKSLPQKDDSSAGLSILTHIEEFADIWGPVWSIPAQSSPNTIQQHNVSKGIICRVDESQSSNGRPVRCHWYD